MKIKKIYPSVPHIKNAKLASAVDNVFAEKVLPIDSVVNAEPGNKKHGIENVSKIILLLVAIISIAVKYKNKKFWLTIISAPFATWSNLWAIVDAVKEIIPAASNALAELRDLDSQETKDLLALLISSITKFVKW